MPNGFNTKELDKHVKEYLRSGGVEPHTCNNEKCMTFIDGVKWAEKNPSDKMLNKIVNMVLAWTYDTEEIGNSENPMAVDFIKRHWND